MSNVTSPGPHRPGADADLAREVAAAIRGIRYGSVEICNPRFARRANRAPREGSASPTHPRGSRGGVNATKGHTSTRVLTGRPEVLAS